MASFMPDEMKELRAYYSQLKETKTSHFRNLFKKKNFDGKIVLNLSARIGWISAMCVRAGASKVYALENSPAFIPVLDAFMAKNAEQATNIEIIHDSIYNIKNEIEQVDVIITDNFDFNILQRSSLHRLVKATQYLKPGGVVYPKKLVVSVQLFRYPVKDHIEGIHVDQFFRHSYRGRQAVHAISALYPMSEPVIFKEFEFNSITLEDLENSSKNVVFVANEESHCLGIFFNSSYTFLDEEIKPSEVRAVYFPETVNCEKDQAIPLGISLSKSSDTDYRLDIDAEPLDVPHDLGCRCYTTKCIVIREMMAKLNFH